MNSQFVNSQFVQIALPIVITLIVTVLAQLFTQNRAFDMLGKNLEMVNRRLDDMRDVLRAETNALGQGLRAEMGGFRAEMGGLRDSHQAEMGGLSHGLRAEMGGPSR
jgi:hypothetical protein